MISPTEENAPAQIQTVGSPTNRKRRRLELLFLILLGLLCIVTFFLDRAVIDWIALHRTKALRNLGGQISHIGDWPWLMACAIPLLFLAWRLKRELLFRIIAAMIVASAVAGIINNSVKLTSGRTRPNNTQVAPGWYGLHHEGQLLIGKNKFNSFPSGHTAAASGFFCALALRRRPWAFLWFLPVLIMAASRMVINAHYLSDVAFGAWIGLVTAWRINLWAARSTWLGRPFKK